MHLYETKTGEGMQGDGFFQPKFSQDKLDQADRLEVWATSFNDAGEYCEFRLMQDNKVIATRTVQGY